MKFIKTILTKIKNSSFWKSVAALSAGQIIALFINTFSILIISRIYSKEAFGDFALVTSTATIIIGFIGLGLTSAIMVPDNDDESEKIIVISLIVQVFLAIICSLVMVIIMPKYKFFYSQISYFVSIVIMFIYIVLTVLSSLMSVYINRLNMDKVLFINPLIGALSTLLLKIPLGLMGLGSIGLYISTLISLLLVNIHMLSKANPFNKWPNTKEFIYIIKKYKNFIIYQYPSNLIGTINTQVPNQVLARSFGVSALGEYDMCNRVIGAPAGLIASPIQTIYFRFVSQKYRDGKDIAGFTYSLVTKLLLVGAIPIIILIGFGEPVFTFVLGDEWASAGNIASILSLQYIFSFCYNCITYCRVAIKKQKVNLFTSSFQFIIVFASLLIGTSLFRTLKGTIICFSIANLFYNIINITITFHCLKKHYFKFLAFSIIYCITCLAIAFILKYLFIY